MDDLDAVGDAYDGVVVKLAKSGGIASAFALVSACTGRGLQVLLGCMVESSLGIAAALQIAGLADYVDLDGALLLAEDPFTGITVDDDLLTASDEPGLGCGRPGERRPQAAARHPGGCCAAASRSLATWAIIAHDRAARDGSRVESALRGGATSGDMP